MPRKRNVVSTIVLDVGKPASIRAARKKAIGGQRKMQNLDRQVLPKVASDLRVRVFGPMLRALRKYPPRKRGMYMRWTNAPQRAAVMIKLKMQAIARGTPNDLSYRRTGAYGKAWTYEIFRRAARLRMRVYNTIIVPWRGQPHRLQKFIVGNIGLGLSATSLRRYAKPIQKFHTDRGWEPASPIIQKYTAKGLLLARERYDEEIEGIFE